MVEGVAEKICVQQENVGVKWSEKKEKRESNVERLLEGVSGETPMHDRLELRDEDSITAVSKSK